MKNLLLTWALLCYLNAFAQKYQYVYRNPADRTYNCYLKVIPETEHIRGLIIRDYSTLPDISRQTPFRLMSLCSKYGLMTIYTVTSNFYPELYYNDSGPALLDDIVHEVLEEYKIPKDNIFIGGISASGTRALRYGQYCEEGKSKYRHKLCGVFAADSPLDLERFYRSAENILKRNASNGMLWEAKLMLKVLPEKLGGSPVEVPEKYKEGSVYSATASSGGNASHYTNLSMIIYHEPDIDWWLNNRSATYYDINSFDIAGFVREVRAQGNGDVTLITTSGKGYDHTGKRKPHSWTIVDEEELLGWILDRIQ